MKGGRNAGMQKAGCPDCQSAMLPILDLGSMIGFVGLEGVVCVPFLVLLFKDRVSLYSPGQSGTHNIYQTSLQLQLSSGIKGMCH